MDSKYKLDGISLDNFTAIVFEYFSLQKGINKAKLRDILVCDRLSCENTGRIPDCLKVLDKRLKTVAKAYAKTDVGVALLYSERKQIVIADYVKKDPVTKRYSLQYINIVE